MAATHFRGISLLQIRGIVNCLVSWLRFLFLIAFREPDFAWIELIVDRFIKKITTDSA